MWGCLVVGCVYVHPIYPRTWHDGSILHASALLAPSCGCVLTPALSHCKVLLCLCNELSMHLMGGWYRHPR